jgi:uncharacterized membrane protein HdeD (DUF308 family)
MEKTMTESNSTATCPMANACKGMMNKPMAGPVLVIPALVFVILGVAVLIEPQILAWIVGIVLIVMGIAMLVFGRFMRRFAESS